jgi:hypothetical protein
MAIGKVDGKDLNPHFDDFAGFAEQRSEEKQRLFEERRAQMIQSMREANSRARRGEDPRQED